MTAPNIQNLIHPPIMPQRIVSRDRLLDLLINNIDKNLIMIYSPAGYGKTTIVQNFLSKQNYNFGWLNVTSEIDHLFSFFRYIVYSLIRINDKFGKNTLEIIDSWNERYRSTNNPKNAINDIVSTFIKEFEEIFNEEIILVFDDLESIGNSDWVKETFNVLFDLIPKNLHLIIITRQVPAFDILPLMEKGNVLKIGMEDLIFRFDEIIDLVKDIYSLDYSEDCIRLLENNIGGWITGIHLILKSYGKDLSNINIDFQKIPENIFNFLANEIFKQFDAKTQNLLVLSSLLEGFNPDICHHALNIKQSDEIIRSLIDKNLFIQPVPVVYDESEGYSISYRYQILFKKFLNQKLYELYSIDNVQKIIKKIYKYYCDKGDFVSAIDILLKTKDYKLIIPVIIEHFDKLFDEGQFEYLWKWLKQIEDEVNVNNPYIMFYLARLYKFFIGDLNKSLEYFDKAIKLFEKHNDQNTLVGCYVMKSAVQMNLGKTKDLIPELTDLLNKNTTTDIRSNLYYFLARAYYQISDYDKAIELLNEALKLSSNERKIKKQTEIYNLLGNICLIKGNFKNSVPFYEKALENDPKLFSKIETYCNLILLNSQSGEFTKAEDNLEKLTELVKKFPTPMFKMPYLLTKQGYLFETGKYDENIKLIEELNSIAKYMNHKQYLYLSYRFLTDSYYYMHNLTKAQEYLELSEQLVDSNNELENIELQTIKALISNTSSSDVSTEKVLLKTYEYYKSNDYIYPLVQVSYKLANWYYLNGQKEKALRYIEESLASAEKNNFISYFIREYNYSSEFLNFCLDNKIQTDFIDKIIQATNHFAVTA